MSRNLLAKHKLELYKEWLTEHAIAHRPPRGEYEVLQVGVNGRWECLFDKYVATEHYTVAKPLEKIVWRFIKETRAQRGLLT